MTAILKKWLSMRLETSLKWQPEDFGIAVRDGVVLCRLLKSYNIISLKEMALVKPSDDIYVIKANLHLIKDWLKVIQIDLNEGDINQIAEGKGSITLRLFYQIFLELDGKDRLYFISRKDIDSYVSLNGSISPPPDEKPKHGLCKKKVNLQFAEKIVCKSKLRDTNIGEEAKSDIYQEASCETFNYTYAELKKLEEIALNNVLNGKLTDKARATKYENKLKQNAKADLENRRDIEEEDSILDKMLSFCAEKEDQIKNIITIIEVAKHEKRLVEQLLEAKQNATLVVKSRLKQQEEIANNRKIEFAKALDNIKHQIKEKNKQLEFEREILTILNRKLDIKNNAISLFEMYSICKDTLAAILNYVQKIVDFKQMSGNDHIPQDCLDDWKALLLYGENESDIIEDIEQHVLEERFILDEREFLNYINEQNGWHVDFNLDNGELVEESTYKIFGHILKKIFSPKTSSPEKSDPIPKKAVAAILLNGNKVWNELYFEELISEKNIITITVNAAIIYCLEEFKKEMIDFDEVTSDFQMFEMEMKQSASLYNVKSSTSENSSVGDSKLETSKNISSKHTQTPRKLPLMDQYSDTARLGKLLFELLKDGNFIPDDIVASVVADFLKNNSEVEGWILIDYPKTLTQAKYLEETLTGNTVTGDLETESELSIHKPIPDSRIVQFPSDIKLPSTQFNSYFTAFIKLKQTECIENEDFIWKLTKTNSTSIERFYAEQGINYSIYYETFNESTIQWIVKYLTGDIITSPPENSQSDIKSTPGSVTDVTPDCSMRVLKNSIKGSKVISSTQNSFEVKNSSVISQYSKSSKRKSSSILNKTSSSLSASKQRKSQQRTSKVSTSSESRWQFCDYPLPLETLTTIQELWNKIECVYTCDLKDMFAAKRDISIEMITYISYARNILQVDNADSSLMQDLVNAFQHDLLSLDCESKRSSIVKGNMYFTIEEMRKELTEITSNGKIAEEQKRKNLIEEDWFTINMATLCNLFINLIQIELNRSCETLKIICHYYYTIFGYGSPTAEMENIIISKIRLESGKDLENTEDINRTNVNVNNDDLTTFSYYVQNKLLQNEETSDIDNPFFLPIENSKSTVEKHSEVIYKFYKDLIDKERNSPAQIKKQDPKNIKNVSETNISNKSVDQNQVNPMKLATEWEYAVEEELCRLRRRLAIIRKKAFEKLNVSETLVFENFSEASKLQDDYFNTKTAVVDEICSLFSLAVEKEIQIPVQLCIDSDDILVEIGRIKNTIIEKDTTKHVNKCDFPIGQLARLRSKLMLIAKNCSIPKKALAIVLQDFFLINPYTLGNVTCSWILLEPDDFFIIIDDVFGEIDYADWRDFIILCFDLNFPTTAELLKLRTQFMKYDPNQCETINREDYAMIVFWFEPEEGCQDNHYILRACLMKELLFLLFEVSDDIMNYSAFLLALCKCEFPEDGFVNALSISVGKTVSRNVILGEKLECEFIEELKVKEAEHLYALSMADDLVTGMIDHTIRICSEVNISDIITPQGSTECFDRKYTGETRPEIKKPEKKPSEEVTSQGKKESNININKSNVSVATGSGASKSKSLTKSSKSKSVVIEKVKSVHEEVKKVESVHEEVNMETICILSEKIIMRVILASLPWHCRVEFSPPMRDILDGLQDTLVELKYCSNCKEIFIHRLLSHQFMKTLLNTIYKFKLCKPCHVATELIFDKQFKF